MDVGDRSGEIVTAASIGEWEVEYSRFFNFPVPSPFPFPTVNLRRLPSCKTRAGGTWMNTSCRSLILRLAKLHSAGDPVLSVSIPGGETYEEHYVSDLNIIWPQLSCASQCPVKGSRVVFVSFTRSLIQIEKFAVRFSTRCDVVSFLNAVKENSKNPIPFEDSDIASRSSTVSETVTSNGVYDRFRDEPSIGEHVSSVVFKDVEKQGSSQRTVFIDTETDSNSLPRSSTHQISILSADNEITNENSQISDLYTSNDICDRENTTDHISSLSSKDAEKEGSRQPPVTTDVRPTIDGLPPSFTELVASCSAGNRKVSISDVAGAVEQPIPETTNTTSTIASEVEKYLSDDTFMDMVARIEGVITELGGNLSL